MDTVGLSTASARLTATAATMCPRAFRLSVLCFTTTGAVLVGHDHPVVAGSSVAGRFYVTPDTASTLCSYHGVAETDLVNLTSCFGYELWRFSTTCTLILESVKATGIVLLLGVGSFVCYRLYHRYHRRRSSSSSTSSSDAADDNGVRIDVSTSASTTSDDARWWGYVLPRRRQRRRHRSPQHIVRWVSRELIGTFGDTDRNEDLHDIKREYFGPDDNRADGFRRSSFHRANDGLSSLASSRLFGHHVHLQSQRFRVVNRHAMGHCSSHSSTASMQPPPSSSSDKAVRYNIHSGSVHIPMHVIRRREPDGHQPPSSSSSSSSMRRKRPNSLPLRCHGRRTTDDVQPSIKSTSVEFKQQRKGSDGDSNSADSLRSTDEEGGIDGDDEDCDDHVSGVRFRGANQSGSMVANFSPSSLLKRHIRLSPNDHRSVRLSPDGTDGQQEDDTDHDVRLIRKTTYVVHSPSSSVESVMVDDFLDASDHRRMNVQVHSTLPRASSSDMQRDISFGSEFSEMSVDTSVFNDIGVATQAKIESIQLEIDSVKRDIESYMQDNVNVSGPTPTAFTELVKPSTSEGNEGSSDDVTSDSQGIDILKRQEKNRHHEAMKRRAEFRRIRVSTATTTSTPEHRSSYDTSFDRHSSPSSAAAAAAVGSENGNTSVNLSLEWESMKCNSSGGSIDGTSELRKRVVQSRNSNAAAMVTGAVHGGDSGSDFGTPLTNGSPESCRKKRSGSIASLEWDDQEFEMSPSSVRVTGGGVDFNYQSSDHQQQQQQSGSISLRGGPTRRLSCNNFTAIDELPAPNKDSPSSSALIVAADEKKMWSSMESGYVDEFSSSQVSPQDYSLATTASASASASAQNNRAQKNPTLVVERPTLSPESGAIRELHRTWPVVGQRVTMAKAFSQMSSKVRKEFFTICKHLSFAHARPIHSDHYCALRAVLVQALAQGFSVLEYSGGADQIKKKLGTWMRSRSRSWIRKWNFARRIPQVTRENCLSRMLDCLQALDWLVSCVLSSQDRERVTVDALNSDTVLDVQVMEGMKLLLLCTAIDLYEAMTIEQVVPAFVSLLFARETSPTPEAFLVNHLNSIGHTCGPGHMEMQMLGHVLGVTICVLNPSKDEQREEFITYYPDYDLGSRPEIYLASVDGQGFSIIVK